MRVKGLKKTLRGHSFKESRAYPGRKKNSSLLRHKYQKERGGERGHPNLVWDAEKGKGKRPGKERNSRYPGGGKRSRSIRCWRGCFQREPDIVSMYSTPSGLGETALQGRGGQGPINIKGKTFDMKELRDKASCREKKRRVGRR